MPVPECNRCMEYERGELGLGRCARSGWTVTRERADPLIWKDAGTCGPEGKFFRVQRFYPGTPPRHAH